MQSFFILPYIKRNLPDHPVVSPSGEVCMVYYGRIPRFSRPSKWLYNNSIKYTGLNSFHHSTNNIIGLLIIRHIPLKFYINSFF